MARGTRTLVLLFSTSLCLSSMLMFLLEPMAAKMVLPLLGGAPAVWNTCVVFFQGMLLAGYAYAHAGPALLGVRRHAALHVILIIISMLTIQLSIGANATYSDGNPIAWLLVLLLRFIGLPFFVLATTAPLLQKWFSCTDHRAAGDPYFLYTASNLGSLAGLVMYPSVVEPVLRLGNQAMVWSFGYGLFAVLVIGCAAVLWRRSVVLTLPETTRAVEIENDLEAPIGPGRRLRWVALAFAPSSLMLAVTTFVSTDIAAVPLLWIVPLALYLLTFVLAFSSPPRYPRAVVDRGFPLLLLPLIAFMILQINGPTALVLPVHLTVFFLAALVCHRELADDRPTATHLTEFYFWLALGGILGSLFNTLVAPILFSGIAEYPLVVMLVCLLRPPSRAEAPRPRIQEFVAPVVAGALTLLVVFWGSGIESAVVRFALLGVPAFLCLSVSRVPWSFAFGIGLMLLASAFQPDQRGRVLHAERTFFGTYKVRMHPGGHYRTLSHGTTLHGMQSVAPERQNEPLSYYHPTGPVGDVFSSISSTASNQEVAVVGLGIGSLATYRRPGQQWTFFEIDPAVEHIARRADYFSYLADCSTACAVVLGDARQSLQAMPDRSFGLIVLDAFSSDAIPIHLMTREALSLYVERLAPMGVLAFHVSNRHLGLEPVLARLAEQAQLVALIRRDRIPNDESANGKTSSDWVVMARNMNELGALATDSRWTRAVTSPEVALWTDDFSNILSVLTKR